MKQPKETPVIAFLKAVWANCNTAIPHSWERLNHSMSTALSLAIGSGFEFVADDFRNLEQFRVGRWIGASDEWVYSMAVVHGNLSAATAYEQWKEREPIIADGVRPRELHDGYSHLTSGRQRERLHVGCWLLWCGEMVKVTSFNRDGAAIACSYHKAKKRYESDKLKKRYAITRDAVIESRKKRKETKEPKP